MVCLVSVRHEEQIKNIGVLFIVNIFLDETGGKKEVKSFRANLSVSNYGLKKLLKGFEESEQKAIKLIKREHFRLKFKAPSE